jgi:hypothetical protein
LAFEDYGAMQFQMNLTQSADEEQQVIILTNAKCDDDSRVWNIASFWDFSFKSIHESLAFYLVFNLYYLTDVFSYIFKPFNNSLLPGYWVKLGCELGEVKNFVLQNI